MAAAITVLSVTPNSLKYLWTHDAAGSGVATRTRAQMVTDLQTVTTAKSNLLEALAANYVSDVQWATLGRLADVSIYTTILALAAGSSVGATPTIGPQALTVDGLDANAGTCIVEVKFINSTDR